MVKMEDHHRLSVGHGTSSFNVFDAGLIDKSLSGPSAAPAHSALLVGPGDTSVAHMSPPCPHGEESCPVSFADSGDLVDTSHCTDSVSDSEDSDGTPTPPDDGDRGASGAPGATDASDGKTSTKLAADTKIFVLSSLQPFDFEHSSGMEQGVPPGKKMPLSADYSWNHFFLTTAVKEWDGLGDLPPSPGDLLGSAGVLLDASVRPPEQAGFPPGGPTELMSSAPSSATPSLIILPPSAVPTAPQSTTLVSPSGPAAPTSRSRSPRSVTSTSRPAGSTRSSQQASLHPGGGCGLRSGPQPPRPKPIPKSYASIPESGKKPRSIAPLTMHSDRADPRPSDEGPARFNAGIILRVAAGGKTFYDARVDRIQGSAYNKSGVNTRSENGFQEGLDAWAVKMVRDVVAGFVMFWRESERSLRDQKGSFMGKVEDDTAALTKGTSNLSFWRLKKPVPTISATSKLNEAFFRYALGRVFPVNMGSGLDDPLSDETEDGNHGGGHSAAFRRALREHHRSALREVLRETDFQFRDSQFVPAEDEHHFLEVFCKEAETSLSSSAEKVHELLNLSPGTTFHGEAYIGELKKLKGFAEDGEKALVKKAGKMGLVSDASERLSSHLDSMSCSWMDRHQWGCRTVCETMFLFLSPTPGKLKIPLVRSDAERC